VPELTPRSALAAVVVAGHYTRRDTPGVTLSERTGVGLATIAARRGQASRLAATMRDTYGIALPAGPKVVRGRDLTIMGTALGQWLAVSDTLAYGALADDLASRVTGVASVTDQSDGRAIVRISGPRARDVLAKGLPIDLHPKVFGTGDAATTVASLIGVQLWQVDDAPTYDLAVFRGYAESFWYWITSSAAEFGYVIDSPQG
jgi:sarcosine oxidase subunit gamma